jgi:hypothetical protein
MSAGHQPDLAGGGSPRPKGASRWRGFKSEQAAEAFKAARAAAQVHFFTNMSSLP